ncbi:location of vulva defective 1-like isoform X2 [Haliotis rufescens]|uniref:location of vulva defective 1-like isoform X2 n=1 Tax=Haliotis rufescens TaxID=6454 RepID=UPI00201F1013|nr:location of vulva defective 1-like isoform X2 [Haliotis rufescens]
MDKLYTITAYLFLVTCIATHCTAMSRGTTSSERGIDADGYTIHIYGRMERSQEVKIIHVNVTILAETSIATLCFSTKCNLNQPVSLQEITSDKCKHVCRQTWCKSNAFYRATYNVMLHCTSPHRDQTCDMHLINVTFTCKDGNRWNRTCIGLGELPPCYTSRPETCPDIIRCVCEAESKNCTPTTTLTTPVTNGTTTPDTITRTTTSSEPTITTSSGSARDTTATNTTASDTPAGTTTPVSASGKTSSGTPAGTATSDPASGKTSSGTPTDGQDRSQIGVLIGGVVGGLFGGVVITVVIVFLSRACRSNRRHTEDEDGAGTKESHTCIGLIHTTSCSGKSPPGTNAVKSQVPDLIKVSAVQQASSAPSDVYDVIKEGDDYQLGVDPSVCDQGDYVDITDDMTGAAVYSLAQAPPVMAAQGGTPQPAAEYFVLEKDDPTDCDYNKLVRDGATETGTDVQGTYNRLGREGATETTTDVQGTYNRLGRDGATETGTDVQGTYNRLGRDGATETTTDVQDTYNKLGSTKYDNDDNEPGRNIGTAADYFVLETPEDTSNKLAQAAPGMAIQDGTPPSAAEYFVLEKDDPTDGDYNRLVRGGATETTTVVQGTYNRLNREGATETTTDVQGTYNRLGRGGATETTTDVQGTYNRLGREGATETTTDVQGTYNKLGSVADDNEDNEPAGNNGTAADYFVLEKPEDTYNKLEGKRSAEEEQEPYTKLGEATPKRESEPPDDPGEPSREYFILEDQT